MVSHEIFDDYCTNFNGICFIAFLPDVRDSGEEKRQKYIEELKELRENMRGQPFTFLWVQGGKNFDFEERF